MHLGNLILLSITGYLILLIHDLSQMKDRNIATLITYISYPIILTPYILIFFIYTPNNSIPIWLTIFFIILIPVLFLLLIYSVLLEIPLKIRQGKLSVNPQDRSVYKMGTYGFSRHPGFIWMTLFNAVIYGLFLQREIHC